MKLPSKKLTLSLFLSFILVSSQFFIMAKPVHAILNPTFTVSVPEGSAGANENLTISLSEPVGTDFIVSGTIRVPAGWDFAPGTAFAQDAILGNGSFTGVISGVSQTFSITIKNDLDLQGNKAHWKFEIGPSVVDSFLTGDVTNGHSFGLAAPTGITIDTPSSITFTLSGVVNGSAFITNPTTAGDYTWEADFTSASSVTVTRAVTVSIPGTVTPVGNNVDVPLSNGVSIEYGTVTAEGVTTMTTTSTTPPEGTGQFQLSGGLYYDINTTATISCPCTITIPYDPATTPNPRIYHLENGVWTDVTTSVDTVNNTVTGVVSSFSFFAVGNPNFTLEWQEKLMEKLTEANPFIIEDDDDEDFDFTIFDSSGNWVTPDNVRVEVWQTHDAAGNPITPVKVLTLVHEIDDRSFESELDLEDTPLDLGTYQVRVLVDNTTVTQTPQTASFTVVED